MVDIRAWSLRAPDLLRSRASSGSILHGWEKPLLHTETKGSHVPRSVLRKPQ